MHRFIVLLRVELWFSLELCLHCISYRSKMEFVHHFFHFVLYGTCALWPLFVMELLHAWLGAPLVDILGCALQRPAKLTTHLVKYTGVLVFLGFQILQGPVLVDLHFLVARRFVMVVAPSPFVVAFLLVTFVRITAWRVRAFIFTGGTTLRFWFLLLLHFLMNLLFHLFLDLLFVLLFSLLHLFFMFLVNFDFGWWLGASQTLLRLSIWFIFIFSWCFLLRMFFFLMRCRLISLDLYHRYWLNQFGDLDRVAICFFNKCTEDWHW